MEVRPHSAAGVSPSSPLDRRPQSSRSADEVEEEEVEKLEEEVSEMAQRISHYRSTMPEKLSSGLAAVLASQRPDLPVLDRSSESGSGRGNDRDLGSQGESSEGVVAAVEDQEAADRIRLLKEKVLNNASAIPVLVKRMKDCISRVDKLSTCSDTIPPAFKRRKS